MSEAAPTCGGLGRLVACASIVILLLPAVAHAAAGTQSTRNRASAPQARYGVEVSSSVARQLGARAFARMRSAKIGFLLVRDASALTAAQRARLATLADRSHLQLVLPAAPPRSQRELAALRAACAATRATVNGCAIAATTKDEADSWLARGRVDFVVRRFRSMRGFHGARGTTFRGASLVVVVEPGASMAMDPWRSAVAAIALERTRSLAMALPDREWGPMLDRYLSLFSAEPKPPSTAAPAPTQPTGLRLTANGLDFLTVHWEPSTPAASPLAGYDLYLDGSFRFRSRWEEATLTGLRCGTTYLVSIEAVDEAGNRSPRASASFTTMWGCARPTPAPTTTTTTTTAPTTPSAPSTPSDTTAPTAPSDLAQTSSTTTSAGLGWSPSSDASGVAGYGVYVGSVLVATTTSTAHEFTGLTCGSSLGVSVDAFDGAGNRSAKTPFVVSAAACTGGGDTTAPSDPGALASSGSTETTVSFSWSASSDDTGVAGYGVYRDGALLGSATGTSYTATALTCGQSFDFAVDAYDAAGNRSGKATATFSTAACPAADTEAPTDPGEPVATDTTATSVSFTWDASSDSVGVAGYGVYRDGSLLASVTQTSYTATGLTCGTTYEFSVDAYDGAGNRSKKKPKAIPSGQCPTDSTPPSAPAGLAVTGASQTAATLSWGASTDDTGVAGYGVYVGSILVATTISTQHDFTGLACGSSLSVSVDAFDAVGNRSTKTPFVVSTAACSTGDTAAPSTPGALVSTGATQTSLSFSWSASSDDVGVAGYDVYRDGTVVASAAGTSFTASGLACGQSYAFAVDAYDAAGNRSAPSSATLATAACPTADTTAPTKPGTPASTGSTASTVSFSWTPSTDAVGVTGYGVYLGDTLLGSTAGTTYTASGLSCAQSYEFSVDAYDAAGNRSPRATAVLATGACAPPADTTPPSAPGPLSLTSATASSISFSWGAASDNVGVTGYEVWVDGVSAATGAGTSFTVTSLVCGTSHAVGVEAYDAAGNRSTRTAATFASAPCADTTPPTTPTGLVKTAGSATTISLSWSPSTDAVGVTAYGVYRNGTLIGSTAATSFSVSGLACGTSYTFEVDAVDGAGNRSGKASLLAATNACVDATAPTAPTGLGQTSSTTTSLGVTWTASSDNVGVTGYRVSVGGTLVGTPTGTSFTVTGLTCGTSYVVSVEAVDAAGNRSAPASATLATAACPPPPPPADTQAPTAPANLAQGALGATSISVTWNASTDNVGVTGYALFRDGAQVATVGSAIATYTFGGLACGTSYVLGVEAFDAAGNRSARSTLTRTTSACADTQAPTVPQGRQATASTETSITMVWLASTDNVGVTGYRVYLNATLVTTTPLLAYTYTGLVCGTTYTLSVAAVDAAGNASDRTLAQGPATTSPCPGDTQAPGAPGSLTSTGSTTTSISLFWSAALDNVAVTGYGVYNGATRVATVTTTSYTVSGLACGTSYTLGVDAVDAAGNRSTKTTLTASTSACAPPPGGSAQVYLSTSGSDANACTQAAPCRSLDRGYRMAAAGGVVEMAAGAYGNQTVNTDASKTSSTDVVFRPAAGASVSVGSLDMNGAHIELRDMTIDQVDFSNSANDVTLRNVVNHGMWWVGSSNISIIGGEISCGACPYHSHMQNAGSSPPRNILFDGVSFHDWHSVSGEHTECLQILGGDGITIRNSTFKDCATGNGGLGATGALFVGFIDGGSGPVTRNVLLENNFFYPSGNAFAIQMSDLENLDLRYNSIASQIIVFDRAGPGTGMDFVGNVLTKSSCTAESNGVPINWRFNVIAGGTCGTTDKNAAAGFVNASSDLHLAAGSAAIDAGDPASFPTGDIDGDGRPRGGAPDAGADETGASAPTGDTTAPTAPTGLASTAATQTSISVSWTASSDNVGVTGYGRYRNGTLLSTATGTSFTFSGLTCGTSYQLGVDAVDAAGNRSTRAQINASTSACTTTPAPGSANLWLDTNGGTCTRQASPGSYVDAQACGSMQAALDAAASGDTVNIVDGTYRGQSFTSSKSVTFRAAGPGRPSFGQLVSAAANVTVRGILVQNRDEQPVPYCGTWILDYTLFICAANQTYDDVIVDGMHHPAGDPQRRGGIQLQGNATGFTFKNGEIRGVWDSKGFQGGADGMVFDNNLWTDIKLTDAGAGAGVHNECAYVSAGDNQVWRRNRFMYCPIMAMFFANYAGGPAFTGVVVENNLFTHAMNDGGWHDGASFVIPNGTSGQNQVNGWIVRYNTFEVAPSIARTPGAGDDNGSALWYGNLGGIDGCGNPEWTYSYNVGAVCGGTGDVSVANATNSRSAPNQSPFYVNAPGGDFHLKAGAAAIDRGDPGRFPSTDNDGKARPVGARADAGAYEFG